MSGIYAKYHAIICLYYSSQEVCNFKINFEIKRKYHCFKPIKLQKFLMYSSVKVEIYF